MKMFGVFGINDSVVRKTPAELPRVYLTWFCVLCVEELPEPRPQRNSETQMILKINTNYHKKTPFAI